MVIARSGARFLSSAASTRAALWRASLSGIWWESRNSRAAEGSGPIAASHATAKIAPSERRMPLPQPNMPQPNMPQPNMPRLRAPARHAQARHAQAQHAQAQHAQAQHAQAQHARAQHAKVASSQSVRARRAPPPTPCRRNGPNAANRRRTGLQTDMEGLRLGRFAARKSAVVVEHG